MKTIKVHMEGTCPAMFNNPQTVNVMNPYAVKIKELTAKKTKTESDLEELLELKFLASCYWNDKGHYYVSGEMIWRSLQAGAKEAKLGKKVEQSVFVPTDAVLQFKDNGCTPQELWDNHNEEYVDIRPVGIMKSKVIAARMIVKEWTLDTEITFDDTQINKGELWNAIVNGGQRHGIGTYRARYGRYKVTEIK